MRAHVLEVDQAGGVMPMSHACMRTNRQHAELSRDDSGLLFLTDLSTSHGTNVDDVWLRPNKPKQLDVGSVIRFGASTRLYKVHAEVIHMMWFGFR